MDGLGEVRLSRGEVVEALTAFNKAIAIDPCLARAHYDLNLYLEPSGMAASAQRELDLAYRIAPTDSLIRRACKATQDPVPTPDSQIADLREIESRPAETAQQKAEIESVIAYRGLAGGLDGSQSCPQ
jgi:tetratricopeptide (TPR) repeat protein